MSRSFQYQSKVEPLQPIAPDAPVSGWYSRWIEPPKSKINAVLAIALIASGLFSPVLGPSNGLASESDQPWSEPVRTKSGLRNYLQQHQAFVPVVTPAAAAVGSVASLVSAGIVYNYSFQYQGYTGPTQVTAENVTIDKWTYPWSEPVRVKIGLGTTLQQSLVAVAFNEDNGIYPKWGFPWSEPVRSKLSLSASQQIASQLVYNFENITVDKWFNPLTAPLRAKLGVHAAVQQTSNIGTNPVVSFGWWASLSEPVRTKPALGAGLQQVFNTDTDPVVSFGWWAPLSEPAKPKVSVAPASQQVSVTDTDPVVSFSYYNWLSEPVKLRRFATALQDSVADVPFIEANLEPKWHQGWPDILYAKKTILAAQQQFFTFYPVPITGEVINYDKWGFPLSEPVRQKPGLGAALQQAFFAEPFILTQPEAVSEDKWHQAWSTPVWRVRGLAVYEQQAFQWGAFTPTATSADQWWRPLVDPVRAKPANTASQQTLAFAPNPIVSFGWFGNLVDPAKPKAGLGIASQQVTATDTDPIVSFGWFGALSEPPKAKISVAVASRQFWTASASPVVPFGWFGNLSDPQKTGKIGLLAALQQAATIDPFILTQPETVTEDRWHQSWSEPLRRKAGLLTSAQVFSVVPVTTETVTVDKWFEPLSTKLLDRARNYAAYQPLPYTPFLQAITIDRWLQPLSVPSRLSKAGLLAAAQQFYRGDPVTPAPVITVGNWFGWLSEPVRRRLGLSVTLQKATEWPPRLLPTSVIVTMAATEDNQDVFAGVILTSKGSARCLVSIEEIAVPQNTPTSIHET